MRLFIAEKPSLGRAIAENLGKGTSKDGCIEINNGQDIVTWCFGHVLEQYDPGEYDERYKKWAMDDLPIVPDEWKLKVKKDAAKQFKIIKELAKKADYIINAGDPDREGQLLIDEVLLHIGNKKPVKRILLNALDQKSVVQALGDLRDNKDYTGLRDSALARSQADWLVGMNLSRAYTIKSRDAGYDSVVHVGRVQTPTLALVVRREEEIRQFRPTTHYVLQVTWQHENGSIPTAWKCKPDMEGLDSENRLLSKEIAEGLLSKIESAANHGDGAQIIAVEQKKKQEGQRLPYSLSTLQVEAGRRFGLSPQQVLDAMQSLYEMKLTTYPRSDCEYLPTNQLSDAAAVIRNIEGISEEHLNEFAARADVKIVSRAWNDAKISAHHALIPTTVPADLTKLSDEQKKLYLLVVKAYLAQFYPIHTYQATKVIISCADEEFVGNGKTILTMGWKEIYQKDKKDPDEWFEVDDTQKMRRVESAYNHVEEVIPLEEALVLKDKEVSRWMLMEIVSRAPAKFIDLLFLARQDDDTEVVHYATTLIAEISRQYDIRLQALEKKHQEKPTDYRVLAEYCAVLEAYLQKDLVTKRMGELLRKDYSNLLEKKLHQKEQLSDYIKLIENDFLLKRYERVQKYLDFVSQKWPHQEAIYMLYLRYYFETSQGERLEELVETIQNGSIYLSKENRERLAFWQS